MVLTSLQNRTYELAMRTNMAEIIHDIPSMNEGALIGVILMLGRLGELIT